MLRTGLGLCLALGLAWCCAAGFDEKDKKDPVRNPLARNPAAIEAGGELFRARCSFCHGLDGKGGGRGSNLTSGEWVHGGKDGDLFSTIRKGVPGTQMPPNDLPDAETWQLVAFIRSLGGAGDQPPVAGDPKRGEELFFGKARCASCHMIRGRGSPFGPELSNVGAARSAAKIRQSILEPSAEILSDWAGARVELRSGEKFDGVIRNEDNFSVQLVDRQGRFRLLDKRKIARLTRLEKESLMPGDIAGTLSPDELQDLLAFLDRQRSSEAKAGNEQSRP